MIYEQSILHDKVTHFLLGWNWTALFLRNYTTREISNQRINIVSTRTNYRSDQLTFQVWFRLRLM